MQGLAVAVFASLLGIPAAVVADRGNRLRVLMVGTVIWSGGTLACGIAQSFDELFAARMLVGIGEVFLFPAALSMIADIAPPNRLSSAIGIFGCGGPDRDGRGTRRRRMVNPSPAPGRRRFVVAARRNVEDGVPDVHRIGYARSRIVVHHVGAAPSPVCGPHPAELLGYRSIFGSALEGVCWGERRIARPLILCICDFRVGHLPCLCEFTG